MLIYPKHKSGTSPPVVQVTTQVFENSISGEISLVFFGNLPQLSSFLPLSCQVHIIQWRIVFKASNLTEFSGILEKPLFCIVYYHLVMCGWYDWESKFFTFSSCNRIVTCDQWLPYWTLKFWVMQRQPLVSHRPKYLDRTEYYLPSPHFFPHSVHHLLPLLHLLHCYRHKTNHSFGSSVGSNCTGKARSLL